METLIDEVSAVAYDKAVEVVTDVVRTETRKEDMRMIEDTKKWVLSPERKAPQATREYATHRLDGVLDKFLKTMQTTAARLQEKLLKPEVRQKGKEQVKEKARDSVLHLLSRLQAEQAQNKNYEYEIRFSRRPGTYPVLQPPATVVASVRASEESASVPPLPLSGRSTKRT